MINPLLRVSVVAGEYVAVVNDHVRVIDDKLSKRPDHVLKLHGIEERMLIFTHMVKLNRFVQRCPLFLIE